ncbi:hypothetical protein [Phytoactinopolyspora limicola]|uniref:hypothetical protein n=1 Tax=Phytoactinopolyspora limicola TaxID=2715536 RepID=UPI00140AD45A|nr:hypothetical protein [Phytoactinopolyspora limicola]
MYGDEAVELLTRCWAVLDGPTGKRLHSAISDVLDNLARHGHLDDVDPAIIDLVGHEGGDNNGAFYYTLDATDVATGWTETITARPRSNGSPPPGSNRYNRGSHSTSPASTPTTARSSSTTTSPAGTTHARSPSPAAAPATRTTKPTSNLQALRRAFKIETKIHHVSGQTRLRTFRPCLPSLYGPHYMGRYAVSCQFR